MNRHAAFVGGMAMGLGGMLAASASAQVTCGTTGPDLTVGDILFPTNYAGQDGLDAFSAGFTHCNYGDVWVDMVALPSTHHSLTGQNLFRYKVVDGAGRFEQIGMSWLMDGFCVLSESLCCACTPAPDCTHLGPGCSYPDNGSIAGQQQLLRPRWQVNPSNGAFPVPAANPGFSGTVARRLQAAVADLNPAIDGGGQYFLEVFQIAADDAAAGNKNNNASYRPCTITGSAGAWNMSVAGQTARGHAAVEAWSAVDPAVVISSVDIPGDGRFILGGRATSLGNGTWRYEYALENLNSDRAGRSFSVPLPAGAIVTNIGFHDVAYHDGDGVGNVNFDGTDWPATAMSSSITWSTDEFAVNANANALRFGTTYNFRFDCNRPPAAEAAAATLGTFKVAGDAILMTIAPGPTLACTADIAPAGSGNGTVDVDDLFAVINAWGPCGDPRGCPADIAPRGGNGEVDVDDLFAVINAWGACP